MVWKLYYEIPSALPPVLYVTYLKRKKRRCKGRSSTIPSRRTANWFDGLITKPRGRLTSQKSRSGVARKLLQSSSDAVLHVTERLSITEECAPLLISVRSLFRQAAV